MGLEINVSFNLAEAREETVYLIRVPIMTDLRPPPGFLPSPAIRIVHGENSKLLGYYPKAPHRAVLDGKEVIYYPSSRPAGRDTIPWLRRKVVDGAMHLRSTSNGVSFCILWRGTVDSSPRRPNPWGSVLVSLVTNDDDEVLDESAMEGLLQENDSVLDAQGQQHRLTLGRRSDGTIMEAVATFQTAGFMGVPILELVVEVVDMKEGGQQSLVSGLRKEDRCR